MIDKNILLVLLPILAGLLGSYLTYYWTLRSKRIEAIQKFKEEKYSNLILHLQGFTGSNATTEKKLAFFEEQYKSWLYASDDVVLAMKDMIDYLLKTQFDPKYQEEQRDVIAEVIVAIRKDMLKKSKLSKKDFRFTSVMDD
ncbi:MAG: hypothetical protein RLO12_21705 [Fulvivirga sp.]